MKGDFTRFTFKRDKNYNSVRMQQGRVQIDADWNEQIEIQNHHNRTESIDVIGSSGVPRQKGGFQIIPVKDNEADAHAYNIAISRGRIYVEGILCENDIDNYACEQDDPPCQLIDYLSQPHLPLQTLPDEVGLYLFYLDVWERHITAVEDQDIRETALGGPDTATRTKTIWQVKFLKINNEINDQGADLTCWDTPTEWTDLLEKQKGGLNARALNVETTQDPCIVAADAGYRRLENQLYRVEIHRPSDPQNNLTPTFKWSRDNAIVLTRLLEIDDSNQNLLTVADPGKDLNLGFGKGQWIEVTDDDRTLNGQPGILVRLAKDAKGNVLEIESWPPYDNTATKPDFNFESETVTVRRWDHSGNGSDFGALQLVTDDWIKLESGIEIYFDGAGDYNTGDYWLIPARAVGGDIEWPKDENNDSLIQPPHGIQHHYSRLALVKTEVDSFGVSLDVVCDARPRFPALTEPDLYYVTGDGQEAMPNTELPQPLEVGVVNCNRPVEGAWVMFKITKGGGYLIPDPNAAVVLELVGSGTSLTKFIIPTNADGRAHCRWHLKDLVPETDEPDQQVETTLLRMPVDNMENRLDVPVIFGASFGVAWQDRYGGARFPYPQHSALEARTVEKALDQLRENIALYYVSGNGQEIMRDHWSTDSLPERQPLPQPLQVRVANGDWPYEGAIVKFEIELGQGHIEAVDSTVNNELADSNSNTYSFEIATDANGLAKCNWTLDRDNWSQQVKTTLVALPDSLSPLDVTSDSEIKFNANLSVAEEVTYDGTDFPDEQHMDLTVETVEAALDQLRENTALHYMGGNGQEARRHQQLPQPLQVRVANGQWPRREAKVRFAVYNDSFGSDGLLEKTQGTPSNPATVQDVLTDVNGLAEVNWTPNGDGAYSQRVTATLIDPLQPTSGAQGIIEFSANLSIAEEVSYDPTIRQDRWKDIIEHDPQTGEPPFPVTVQEAIDDLIHELESSDIYYKFDEVCEKTSYDVDTLYTYILQYFRDLFEIDPTDPNPIKVKIEDMWDALLCGLDASKIPYNATLQQARWDDIVEYDPVTNLPQKPNTVQRAIDDLIQNLESTDIKYVVPDCGETEHPSVRSGLQLTPDTTLKIDQILNKLLCEFYATALPLDKREGRVIADLLNNPDIKTVQDALNLLADRSTGQSCALTVGNGGFFTTLAVAFDELSGADSISLCLLPGDHILSAGSNVTKKHSIKISGAGSASSNIRIEGVAQLAAEEVMLEDLSVIAQGNQTMLALSGKQVSAEACNFHRYIDHTHTWSQNFGGAGVDIARSVAVDADGNVVVTGWFATTINFSTPGIQGSQPANNLEITGNGYDIFVVKFAPNGAHLWSDSFGGLNYDYGHDLAVDAIGNIVLTGYFSGTIDFSTPGVPDSEPASLLEGAGSFDIFVVKFAPNGAHQWSHRFGGTASDRGNSIATDTAGNVLLSGYFSGTINFATPNISNAQPASDLITEGGTDIYITKFSPNGGHQWSQSFGGTSSEYGYSVAVEPAGNVVLTGYFTGTINFATPNVPGSQPAADLAIAGSADIFLAKFATNGAHQWSQHFGGTSADYGYSVAVDLLGNVFLTGYFTNTVNFSTPTKPDSQAAVDLVTAGGYDIFIAKFTSDGAHQWSQRFGGTSSDYAFSVAVDVTGNIVLTGRFAGTISFGDPALHGADGATDLVSEAGSYDIYVARLDPTGAHLWSQSYGSTSTDVAWGVAADADGNILLTGRFEGTINFGDPTLNGADGAQDLVSEAGSVDLFVAKFSPFDTRRPLVLISPVLSQQGGLLPVLDILLASRDRLSAATPVMASATSASVSDFSMASTSVTSTSLRTSTPSISSGLRVNIPSWAPASLQWHGNQMQAAIDPSGRNRPGTALALLDNLVGGLISDNRIAGDIRLLYGLPDMIGVESNSSPITFIEIGPQYLSPNNTLTIQTNLLDRIVSHIEKESIINKSLQKVAKAYDSMIVTENIFTGKESSFIADRITMVGNQFVGADQAFDVAAFVLGYSGTFSDNQAHPNAMIQRVLKNKKQSANILNFLDVLDPVDQPELMILNGDEIPAGTIMAFASANPPEGWLECNGQQLVRNDEPALFDAIGTIHSEGNSAPESPFFNVPDLRGEFVRGWDNGRGVDPRRVLGKFQYDNWRNHDHPFSIAENTGGVGHHQHQTGAFFSTFNGGHSHSIGVNGSTSGPRILGASLTGNVALMYCIKY